MSLLLPSSSCLMPGNYFKILELAKRERWKRCPTCSIYVERNKGCRHV